MKKFTPLNVLIIFALVFVCNIRAATEQIQQGEVDQNQQKHEEACEGCKLDHHENFNDAFPNYNFDDDLFDEELFEGGFRGDEKFYGGRFGGAGGNYLDDDSSSWLDSEL